MFKINNFLNNANMKVVAQKGPFRIFEHERDLSVNPANAVNAYFASEMNVRKRQVFVEIGKTGCITQAGAMQWMLGNVHPALKSALRSAVCRMWLYPAISVIILSL